MSIFGGGWFFGLGLNGQEIYDNFQNGEGGRGMDQASDRIRGMAHKYRSRTDSITQLTVQMEQAWDGPAGGVARRGAGPLAVEHALAAPSINDASVTLKDQVSAFGSTKQAVQNPPPQPKEPSGLENFFSLGAAGNSFDKKKAEYDAVNDTNVAAMGVYEDVSSTNSSRMPITYGSLTSDGAGIGVEGRTPPPIGPPPIGGFPPPGKSGNGSDGTSGTTGTQGTGGSDQNIPKGGDTGGGRDTTLPSRNDPPNRPPYDPTLPPGGRPGPGRGGQDGPYSPVGPYGPGQGGGGSGGRGGGGGFGPRGGGGGFGPGGSGGSGGSGMRGGGGFGPGGAGAAAAAEGAPARGGIGGGGGAGGRGAGGMGGMGGGRGQNNSEDADHERPSFLVEPDPHETFGTDQVTAPPVIGE